MLGGRKGAVAVVLLMGIVAWVELYQQPHGTPDTQPALNREGGRHEYKPVRIALNADGKRHDALTGATVNGDFSVETIGLPPPSATIFTVLSPIGVEPQPPKTKEPVMNPSAWVDKHVVQVSAVLSWLQLGPLVRVLLFGTEQTCSAYLGLAELKQRDSAHVQCVPIRCYREGAPRIDCIFKDAAAKASTDVLIYANADIIVFPDLLQAIGSVHRATPDYFLVAKRYDLNVSRGLRSSLRTAALEGTERKAANGQPQWLTELRTAARTKAVSHAREGIDVMAFPRSKLARVPPFLVGRVQWDNWMLLQAITMPQTLAVEASSVALVVHLNHGLYKASAKKNGTKYNKRLAVYLPHPHVKETKVYHPGTIWLGRLDEVDANLVPNDQRWKQRTSAYFSPTAPLPSGTCPDCTLVKNDQSVEASLFMAHGMAHGRRAVVLVRVAERHMSQAIVYHCLAAAQGVNNVLFVTHEASTHARLRYNGLNTV